MADITGTPMDELLEGGSSADTLEGFSGDDTLIGRDGSDTYLFNAGDGSDTIEDNGFFDTDRVKFADYNPDGATFSRSGDLDLRISFANGDEVLVIKTLNRSSSDGIEIYEFADGTELTNQDVVQLILAGESTDGNDAISGYGAGDTIAGGRGDDTLTGGDGADLYLFSAGDGSDTIEDNGFFDADRVEFTDYNASEATFSRGGDFDLRISFENGDEIVVVNTLNQSSADGIEAYAFADGVVLSNQEVIQLILESEATDGDDSLLGFGAADTLSGGLGDDTLMGRDGSDIYLFSGGDGTDTIEDNGFFDTDRVEFTDYDLSDATFSRASLQAGNFDLRISFANGDELLVVNTLNGSSADGIETYAFADGAVLSNQDVIQLVLATEATDGDDLVTGFSGADTLDGGLGDDTLSGFNGSDTYVFSPGDGADTVEDDGFGDVDRVVFDVYTRADADFGRVSPGNVTDLIITFGGTGSVTVPNTLNLTLSNGIEEYEFSDGEILTQVEINQLILDDEVSGGSDTIIGFVTDDTLTGGVGVLGDTLSGRNGDDTYLIDADYGSDTISEQGDGVDRIDFGFMSSTSAEFNREAAGSTNLVITLPFGSAVFPNEVIVVGGLGTNEDFIVEEFAFSDGILSQADIIELVLQGEPSDGPDLLIGTSDADTLIGGLGNDTLSGLSGGDLYVFNIGDGVDVVDDNVSAGASTDTIRFLGRTLEEATLARTGPGETGDLIISFANGDQVTVIGGLTGQFASTIEFFSFSDGQLTIQEMYQEILDREVSSGDDLLVGFGGDETLNGGQGDDTLRGELGNDTLVDGFGDDQISGGDGNDFYEVGQGHDRIEDAATIVQNTTDTVRMIGPTSIADVTFTRIDPNGSEDLLITVDADDSVEIIGALGIDGANAIERFLFGASFYRPDDIRTEILAREITDGDDTITGFQSNDTLGGGAGDDLLIGHMGGDTYNYFAGDGADRISDHGGAGNLDRLVFHDYLRSEASFLPASSGSDDLRISFGNGDEVIVTDGLADDHSMTIERFVFSDGGFYAIEDILSRLLSDQASDGDDNIIGTSFGDTLDGGLGDDTLSGRGGKDVYIYNLTGADVIEDLGGDGPRDEVQIGGSFGSAIVTRPDPDGFDVVLDYGDGNTLTLIGALEADGPNTIEKYDFIGFTGPEDLQEMRQAVLVAIATDGDDSLVGFDGNETLRGGLGDDTLRGGAFQDSYRFSTGDGQDLIEDVSGSDRLTIAGTHSSFTQFLIHSPENPTWLRIVLPDGDEIVVVDGLAPDTDAGIESIEFVNSPVHPSSFTKADVIAIANNGSPVAMADRFETQQGEIVTGNLLADNGFGVDFDSNFGAVSVSGWSFLGDDYAPGETSINALRSAITVNADGSFVADLTDVWDHLPAGITAQEVFSYTITDDNDGLSATANVTLRVDGLNDPITAVDDNYEAFSDELLVVNTGFGVVGNDTDIDNYPGQLFKLATLLVGPQHGELELSGSGTFTYQADEGYDGQDSFTYEVSDQQGSTDTATVTIDVTAFAPSYDLELSDISLASGQSDGSVALQYTLSNVGNARGMGVAATEFFLSNDGTISADDMSVRLDTPVIDLLEGASVVIETMITLPEDVTGSFTLLAETDGLIGLPERDDQRANNTATGQDPVVIFPDYVAQVVAPQDTYFVGDLVELFGQTFDSETGNVVTAKLVTINVEDAGGDVSQLFAISDTDGFFTASFRPTTGSYEINATSVGFGAEDTQAEDSFTVGGIQFGNNALEAITQPGAELELTASLESFGDFTVSTVEFFGDGADWVTSYTLDGELMDAEVETLSVSLDVPDDVRGIENLGVRVTTVAGATAELTAEIEARNPTPDLVATSISPTEMIRGQANTYEFVLTNTGGAATSELLVSLPSSADFLDLVSAEIIDPLAPGESTVITFLATPDADLALGIYDYDIVVSGEIATEILDLQLRTIDEGSATLVLRIEDEATYFDAINDFPLVEDATVQLVDALTGEMVYENTDVDGTLTLDDVMPGLYNLRVLADGHIATQQLIELTPGSTREINSFIQQSNVSYTWNVTETRIEDQYDINITADFETRIPAPVVVLDQSSYDLSGLQEVGDQMTVIVKATNHGLVRAEDVILTLPSLDNYIFEFISNPLHALEDTAADDGGDFQGITSLEAGGETYFGYTITLLIDPEEDAAISFAEAASTGGANPCVPNDFQGHLKYRYDCGINDVGVSSGTLHYNYKPGETEECNGIAEVNPLGGGVPSGGILPRPVPIEYTCSPLCESQPNLPLCIPGASANVGLVLCGASFAQTFYNYTPMDNDGDGTTDNGNELAFNTIVTLVGCLPGIGDVICAAQWTGWLICAGLGKASGPVNFAAPLEATSTEVVVDYDSLNRFDQGLFLDAAIEDVEPYHYALLAYLESFTGDAQDWLRLDRDGSGRSYAPPEAADFLIMATVVVDAAALGSAGGAFITVSEVDSILTDLLFENKALALNETMLRQFADHWNQSIQRILEEFDAELTTDGVTLVDVEALYASGEVHDYTNGGTEEVAGGMDFDVLINAAEIVEDTNDVAMAQGYSDISAMTVTNSERLWEFLGEVNDGICAKIRVEISQRAVLSRQAFEARLEIENGGVDDLSNILLDIEIIDAAGEVVDPSLFTISAPEFDGGLTAIDGTGTLESDKTGVVTLTIVPNDAAAATGAQAYSIRGNFSYQEGPVPVSMPLISQSVVVQPQASLVLDYFQTREVVADDPQTAKIEASEPFMLAVRVSNEGAGDAQNLAITSQAPEIVRNDNGFDIDFDILGSELDGAGITPSLTVDFGDLAAGETTTAAWFYTAEYQGRFKNFEADFMHVNALGEGQSSQIASVEIHDLIREVQADRPTDDDRPDYLVSDDDDFLWLPDTIYLSDGGQEAVETVVGTSLQDVSHDLAPVTVSADLVDGWSYVRSLDPAVGNYRITEITRSDGSTVSAENYWRTDRTFFVQGEPEYEDVLHILDYNDGAESETYTIQYISIGDLFGTNGADQLNGDAAKNVINALLGNDLIAPGLGADTITTGGGADDVSGTLAELDGDVIRDFSQSDTLQVIGAALDDQNVAVTLGSAIFTIDEDQDGTPDATITLEGDFAAETFILRNDGENSTIQLAGDGFTRLTPAGERFITTDAGANSVFGDRGDDVIGTGGGADLLLGGGGSDVMLAGAGADTLTGGSGADILTGGLGADVFSFDISDFASGAVVADFITDFEVGVDRIELSGFGISGLDDLILQTLPTGEAIVLGNGAFIVLEGIDGADLQAQDITGFDAGRSMSLISMSNLHVLTDANDRFVTTDPGANEVLAGDGIDAVIGGDGNDILRGEEDDDVLIGGAGDDRLVGGQGSDRLTGRDGADRFEFTAGEEIGFVAEFITDYEAEDTLVFEGFGFGSVDDLSFQNVQTGDLAIALSATRFVVLEGITDEAELTGEFAFG